MALPDKLYFRIGEVSELVGVEPHVLRYWETEFGMQPHRSASGQRLYRKEDISLFLRIRKLLHTEGFTIAGARKALDSKDTGEATEVAVDLDKLREAVERLERMRAGLDAIRAEALDLTRFRGGDTSS